MSARRSSHMATTSAAHPAQQRLVDELRRQGIADERVLGAIAKVPRHLFVDDALQSRAYENTALPIGHAQTISQPYVVALMTQAVLGGRKPPQRVLEIGTGCGYQTAILAELVPVVFTVERIKPLSEQARKRLGALHYRNIHFGYADGSQGWLPYAPYDGILVTAGAEAVPPALMQQLAPTGRLVMPVGPPGAQRLKLIERRIAGFHEQDLGAVSFVPLLPGKC